ncbi:MAG: hypothetical protein LBT80_09705 [Lactobacillaceae bacterium]|jgi:hypothetical protein|nr:hypothetical protein [Lactobacillaceae bacterium]
MKTEMEVFNMWRKTVRVTLIDEVHVPPFVGYMSEYSNAGDTPDGIEDAIVVDGRFITWSHIKDIEVVE